MKRLFTLVATAATALATVGCGSNNSDGLDSVSYAMGTGFGLQMQLGMSDLDLDHELITETIRDFYKNGTIDPVQHQEEYMLMMQFQYGRLMPYAQIKNLRETTVTDCPDTLPELPELFDETYTREFVATFMARDFAAYLKDAGREFDIEDVILAIDDARNVASEEEIDSVMRMTQEECQAVLRAEAERQQAEAMAEYQRVLEENAALSAEWLSEVEAMDGVQKTESGLLYRIDREGDGAQATENTDVVLVNYEGKTRTGVVFDSSYERGEPMAIALNRVIAGWTEGMKLVKEGGQITLWIPAELAYGERGAGQDIAPNEALEFKVELLEVNPEE